MDADQENDGEFLKMRGLPVPIEAHWRAGSRSDREDGFFAFNEVLGNDHS